MATIQIAVSLTDVQQTVIQRLTKRRRLQFPLNPPATPKDVLQSLVDESLAGLRDEYDRDDQRALREGYALATPADQDAITTILQKYVTVTP